MRIRLCLPLLALFAWGDIEGQLTTVSLPGARFGIVGGVNFSTFAAPDLGPTASRKGLVGGVSLITPFKLNWATQVEALYSMKGMKSLSETSANTATFKFDYLEVPVMLRGALPMDTRLRPLVYGGPALSFRIQCGAEARANGQTTNVTCEDIERELPSGNGFRKFDWGWIAGGGFALDLGDRTFTLSARYEFGMRPIAKIGESKNRVLSFVASVESPLPRRAVR